MNDIVKYSESAAIAVFKQEDYSHVPRSLQPFIEAKNAPILSQMNENSAKNRLKDIILNLYLANGQNISDDHKSLAAVSIMRDKLYTDFKKKYPTGTINEFDEALNCGVRGEYEEYTGRLFGGITIVNCNIWAKCYFASEKRAEAFKHLSLVPVKELSIEELEEQNKVRQAGFELLKKSFVEPLRKSEQEERRKKSLEFSRRVSAELNMEHVWMEIFDRIQYRQGTQLANGTRYVTRYGKKMTTMDFLHHKLNQRLYVIELLEERKRRLKITR